MELIPKKHTLKTSHLLGTVRTKLTQEIVEMGDYQNLKKNQELTLHCCKFIEHLIEKKSKIDKKQLVIDTLHQVFNFDDVERQIISDQIDFFFDRKMVKSPKITRKIMLHTLNWITKKLL